MSFLKWFTYLIAFGLFVYLVFFKWDMSGATAALLPGSENETEEADTMTYSDNEDDIFIDEKTEPQPAAEDEVWEDETTTDVSATDEPTVEPTTDPVVEQPVSVSDGFDYSKKYLIVVGSFGVKSNAEKMKRRVINDGRNAEIKLINGLHRVIVEATDDRTNARQVRDHFTLIYKERAFILVN